MSASAHIAALDDHALTRLHERLDKAADPDAARLEAHHLVTTEMLKRGMAHGHDGDEWSRGMVLVEKVEVAPGDDLAVPEDMRPVLAKSLQDGGTLSVILTVDGYVMKAEPTVSDVHVDTIMQPARRRRRRLQPPAQDMLDLPMPVGKADGYEVPGDVQAAARQALEWIADGRAGDGFTSVGRNRARQLADGGSVGRDTLVKMRAYFARHVVDKQADGWGDKSDPTPGMVAWYAWGGDAGRAWANRALASMGKAYDPNSALTGKERALYDAYERVAAQYGEFTPDEAHYMPADANPFQGDGMACANCVFYDGGGGCEILTEQVDAMGLCKLWVIPAGMLDDDEESVLQTMDAEDLAGFASYAYLADDYEMAKRGNPEPLRDYWRAGGKGKIAWGAGGDFTACVAAVSKYMDSEQAKGYCAIRHREVTGMWPGDKRNRTHKASSTITLDTVPGPTVSTFTLPDGATYTFAMPVAKHGDPSRPGYAQMHGGSGKAAQPSVVERGSMPTLGRETRDLIGKHLSRGQIADEYGTSYAQGEKARKADPAEARRQAESRIAERDSRATQLRKASDLEAESLAAVVVDHQGFIDGALGRRPSFPRQAGVGYRLAQAMSSGVSGAFKAFEPVVKHPGHPDQKVHGRRGGAASGSPGRMTVDQLPTLSRTYPSRVQDAIDSKPDRIDTPYGSIDRTMSAWHHMVPNGAGGYKFTEERKALHEKIIQDTLGSVPGGRAEPTIVVMGGGGGVGKGTLLKSGALDDSMPDGGMRDGQHVKIDADELKIALPEYGLAVKAGNKTDVANYVHEESSILAKAVGKAAIAQRSHVVLDGTGDSKAEKLQGKIDEHRAAGYTVKAEYVTAPAVTGRWDEAGRGAWERNVVRAATTERGLVPSAELLSAHAAVSGLVPGKASEFDSFRLWDTTGGGRTVIATGTRGGRIQVRDQRRYDTFLAKKDAKYDTQALLDGIPAEYRSQIGGLT